MTLVDFLRGRLDEDEANAYDCECVVGGGWSEARTLAEVKAKRAIVDEFQMWSDAPNPDAAVVWNALKPVVRALAQPYADHPDFRPEWRP